MPVYLVDYDLNGLNKNYPGVISRIESFGKNFCKILKSSWLVYHANWTADDVYKYVAQEMDRNDRIFVSRVSSDMAGWLDKQATEWLNAALKLP